MCCVRQIKIMSDSITCVSAGRVRGVTTFSGEKDQVVPDIWCLWCMGGCTDYFGPPAARPNGRWCLAMSLPDWRDTGARLRHDGFDSVDACT